MIRRSLVTAVTSAAAILILAAGCSENVPTAAQLQPTQVAKVLTGSYQPGSYTSVITPRGGTIDFGIGSISFPAGAVSRATKITATVDGENLAVDFQPHGTVFPAGAQPTLTFGLPERARTSVQILYVGDRFEILETVATSADTSRGSASGQIRHFSRYVIATD